MKTTWTTILRAAVLGGLAAAAVGSARAQYQPLGGAYALGDAVAGFTTGSDNDLMVNLGPISSLASGDEWNLNTLLGTGTGDAGNASLNNLNWGVIGASGGVYYSTAINNTSPVAKGTGQNANELTTLFGGIGSSGSALDLASDTYSWYNNVDQANGPTTSPYAVLGNSPDTTTPASGSFTFAQDSATWNTSGSSGAQQPQGFSFSSDGILLYGTAPIPEPASVALFSGAGFLCLLLRNRMFRRG